MEFSVSSNFSCYLKFTIKDSCREDEKIFSARVKTQPASANFSKC